MHGLDADKAFLDVAIHPDVLDVIEQLVGPDLILWNTLMFYKRVEAGPMVPWHRDGFGYPIEPIATTSIWIAVTESTSDNGCLRFIPGSHLTSDPGVHDSTPKPGEMFSGTLDPTSFDESTAVDAALEPGQFVIFDVYTIHGSQPNRGAEPRAGY
jgi:ectoine hydroxylase-related dioxygenase (phytanoyl-CoA dioxygenase family)